MSPHFYGELTKTKEGADLLENSKHFPYFISLITPSNNNNIIIDPLDVKAALLAIGKFLFFNLFFYFFYFFLFIILNLFLIFLFIVYYYF